MIKTLGQTLQARSADNKTITYITGKNEETVVSYKELYVRACSLLHTFQSKGLKPGDELIIFLRDNEKFLEAFWAAVLGGIVPVPVAVGISDEHRAKLFRIFNLLDKAYLYTDEENLERLSSYAFENVLGEDFKRLKAHTVPVQDSLDESQQGQLYDASEEDTAFIQFSSGSTSDPKGIVLSHKNLITNMHSKIAGGKYTDQDISLSWMPLTHDLGLIGFHLTMMLCNMDQCLIPTDLFSRRPVIWLQKASEKKATILTSPNFGYKHFLKALGDKPLEGVDLSHVRLILNGAEPISVDLCDEFLARMAPYGLKQESMFTVYGLAEATLAVAFPEPETPYRAVSLNRDSINTGNTVEVVNRDANNAVSFAIVGRALPDCYIRITGADGKELPENVIGDIEISGGGVTSAFYKNPQAYAEVSTEDGWLKTGDLGFMYNGELVITGRAKEIIFVNGQNYYPHDLEYVLQQAAGFELGKVVACGVHRDETQKEELLIFVLYRNDLSAFTEISRNVTRVLNEQLGVEVTHVLPVKRIPKTTSGKIQRRSMGADYLAGEYDELLAELSRAAEPAADESANATDFEQSIKTIFDSVLEGKNIGLSDNFFELGISSLALAEAHQKMDDKYPGVVDITDLFEYQTIQEVAGMMQNKLDNASTA